MRVRQVEKQTKEVEIVIESYTLCDKCNEKIEDRIYDAFEFEFTHTTGHSYPEGGYGEKQEMDLCKGCAAELVNFLRLSGYRISDSKWDW